MSDALWEVVLSAGNDERRYYVRAKTREFAVDEALEQWSDEFGDRDTRIVSGEVAEQECSKPWPEEADQW